MDMTVKEAAAEIGCAAITLYQWIKKGRAKATRAGTTYGHRLKLTQEEVQRLKELGVPGVGRPKVRQLKSGRPPNWAAVTMHSTKELTEKIDRAALAEGISRSEWMNRACRERLSGMRRRYKKRQVPEAKTPEYLRDHH